MVRKPSSFTHFHTKYEQGNYMTTAFNAEPSDHSDVFLSHHSNDKPVVEEIARRLQAIGVVPWLDKWNLIPGGLWQEALERALAGATTCAVFIGADGMGPWQHAEMRAAINRRVQQGQGHFRVIPVLLPGGSRGARSTLPEFLTQTTWVEFGQSLDDEEAFRRLVAGIRGVAPGAMDAAAGSAGAGQCPYRGLEVFDVEHAGMFFGRESLTQWLVDAIRPGKGHRFLGLVGPSGSGKSSLARAGILAQLRSGNGVIPGSQHWAQVILKPGAKPLESLAIALCREPALGLAQNVGDLIRLMREHPLQLHWLVRQALHGQPEGRRVVILIDQFEEIFTLCGDDGERQAFVDNLLTAATDVTGQAVVLVTMRADFYGKCALYPQLSAALSDNHCLVGPMTEAELREAVERPAQRSGGELEPGLTEVILSDVKHQPGYLPLLEYALTRLWEMRASWQLKLADYQRFGGVEGALKQKADEVYSGMTPEQQVMCRQIFLRLVRPGEGTGDTRRRASFEEFGQDAAVLAVVKLLADARLITTQRPAGSEQPVAEVAHEALIRNWPQLRAWIEHSREALRTQHQVSQATHEWVASQKDGAWLLTGSRLQLAHEWLSAHSEDASPTEREFVETGIRQRDAIELEKQARQQREIGRARRQVVGVSIGLIFAAGLVVLALMQTRAAREAEYKSQIEAARANQETEKVKNIKKETEDLVEVTIKTIIGLGDEAAEKYISNISDEQRDALAALVKPLIVKTESIDEKEREYWLTILPSMTDEQVIRLLNILFNERRQLQELNSKYADKINKINDKWKEMEKNPDVMEAYLVDKIKNRPNDAGAFVMYAKFLAETKKDLVGAELNYKNAIALDENNSDVVVEYAEFLNNSKKDAVGAEIFYKKSIGMPSGKAKNMVSYALFLENEKKDYRGADEMYKSAINVRPDYGGAIVLRTILLAGRLNNFAEADQVFGGLKRMTPGLAKGVSVYLNLLRKNGGSHDKIDAIYSKLIGSAPKSVVGLTDYAIFLQITGRDHKKAVQLYERAIKIDDGDANLMGNLSQLYLSQGGMERGQFLIDQAFKKAKRPGNGPLLLELWFYRLSHFPKKYPEAREKIVAMLKDGVRDEDWDFSRTIARAEADGHPDVPMLKKLADVILKKQPLESL